MSYNQHPAGEFLMKEARTKKLPAATKTEKVEAVKVEDQKPVLDAVAPPVTPAVAPPVTPAAAPAVVEPVLDDVGTPSDDYTSTDIAIKSAAAVQEWAETSPDDLDTGEGLGNRLLALLLGIADVDMDGEVGEDEQGVLDMALDAADQYLSEKGVSREDVDALLNDFDDDVAARVQELIASRLPDGEEAAAADINDFVFGDGSDEAAMDAVYKKKIAFRKGKKTLIRKRVSGHVRLSAKQKVAVRKMLRKTHSAAAQMHRAKSMRVRARAMA